jgi:hypothetical protein
MSLLLEITQKFGIILSIPHHNARLLLAAWVVQLFLLHPRPRANEDKQEILQQFVKGFTK